MHLLKADWHIPNPAKKRQKKKKKIHNQIIRSSIIFKHHPRPLPIPLTHSPSRLKHDLPRGFHIHIPVPSDLLAQNTPHFTVFVIPTLPQTPTR